MPEDLTTWAGGNWIGATLPPKVTGFTQDSRTIGEGEMFVALTTSNRDGHDFIPAAEQAGAAAALVERPIESALPQLLVPNTLEGFQAIAAKHRAAYTGKVVGITGSCGKTSTKDLLALLLGERTLRTEGNLNNFLGVPLTLTKLDRKQHDYAVVEAGINERGEMQTLADMIAPDIAIVTCVGPAHLEKLGTTAGVAEEKAKLGTTAPTVIFPGDCLQYAPFRNHGDRALVVSSDAKLLATLPEKLRVLCTLGNVGMDGCRLQLESAATPPGTYELPFSSPGMVSNAALAITAALLCGVAVNLVQERLLSWRPSRNRGEWRTIGRQHFYSDSYNANPASMAEAFAAFTMGAPQDMPHLYVLGGMKELGVNSRSYHRETGARIQLRSQDRALLIGSEAAGYREGLLDAGNAPEQITLLDKVADATHGVHVFEGAVLLKASRAYALETLLPAINKEADAC